MIPQRPFKRSERVTSLITSALNEIILEEMNFEGAIATITDIELKDKLDYAKIYIAVIPSNRSETVLILLNKRLPYLQSLLMKKINIRPTPTISFELDKGAEAAAKVEKALLDEKAKNR